MDTKAITELRYVLLCSLEKKEEAVQVYTTKVSEENDDELSSPVDVNRTNSYQSKTILELPHGFFIGQSRADGNCFFDCFRLGLQQTGHYNVTVKFLRIKCSEFALNFPPQWFIDAIGNSYNSDISVRRETTAQYIHNIPKSTRWGDPEVEGRILCDYFKVILYVAEQQDIAGNKIYAYQKIDANGAKSINDIDYENNSGIFMVNQGQTHFEPILSKAALPNDNINLHKDGLQKSFNNKMSTGSNNTRTRVTSEPAHQRKRKNNCRRNSFSSDMSIEKRLVFNALKHIKHSIESGDLDKIKNLIKFIYQTYDKTLLSNIYYENDNPIRNTHLITLACKNNQPIILDFLLNDTDFLFYLPNEGTTFEKACKEALHATMVLFNTTMLEMLYDYWSGDLHWPLSSNDKITNDIIPNLKLLRELLTQSRNECIKYLKEECQPMAFDVHCLLSFNSFQIDLYERLSNLKVKLSKTAPDADSCKNNVEAIKSVILTAYETYDEYAQKDIQYHIKDKKLAQHSLFNSNIISEMKMNSYIKFEIYYRKMDFNIALLIINNLHMLKQRLDLPEDSYQKIECALYYFLYRVNENWEQYLPKNQFKYKTYTKNESLLHKNGHRVNNVPVLYLEWTNFRKSLNKFIDTLRTVDIEKKIRNKIPEEEEKNSLTLLPYMRDNYSLKQMIKYLKITTKVDFKHNKSKYMLIVQRVMQILGEFMKNSEIGDTCHLSSTTKALLHTEIPRNVGLLLRDIRNDFSHIRDGELSNRIHLEIFEVETFKNLISDVDKITDAINDIINLYTPLLEKDMIDRGLQLINDKTDNLPMEAKQKLHYIDVLFYMHPDCNIDNLMELEEEFLREWNKLGLSNELFQEIGCLLQNKKNLLFRQTQKAYQAIKQYSMKLPIYSDTILQTLIEIENQNKEWSLFLIDFAVILDGLTLNKYPNKNCIKNIKDFLRTGNSKSICRKINTRLENFEDRANDWKNIKNIFIFIAEDVKLFMSFIFRDLLRNTEKNNCNITRSESKELYKEFIGNANPDTKGIETARRLLKSIIDETTLYSEHGSLPIPEEKPNHDYKAIKNLADKLKGKLTEDDTNYLSNSIRFHCKCSPITNKKCIYCQITQKIPANKTLSVVEFNKINSLNLDDKCKKIVENLTSKGQQKYNTLECLVNRIRHLDSLLEGCRDHKLLVLRYKQDDIFRTAIEIIISDVMNVFYEGGLPELFNVIFSKMLAEYPLRNILEHGNPHIDVVGLSLDSNDFPSALISFVLDFIKDNEYLEDLLKLNEGGVGRHDAYCSTNLSNEHLILVNSFKRSSKWINYIKLLPGKVRRRT